MSRLLAPLLLVTAAITLAGQAQAAGTAAGTDISNTASASFTDPGGIPSTVSSNTAVLKVDEILDVTIVANDAGNVSVTTPEGNRALSFTVTNTGNGSETYMLSALGTLGGDQFNPANVRVYLDNGDNIFDSLTDTLLVSGGNDPVLAADGSIKVFVVSDIPVGLNNGDIGLVRLTAESLTAQATPVLDAPGTAFGGQGSNGSDAVVGNTQSYATRDNGYAVTQVATTLSKSQTVLDPFGGTNPVPGATITYSLTFTAAGVGSLTGTQIVDAIPASTTYVAGSLTLDSSSLSDTADGDAGRFTGTGIEVGLGTLAAPATRTVTFQVTIN